MAKINYVDGKVDVEDYLRHAASEMANAKMANYKKKGGDFGNMPETEMFRLFYNKSKEALRNGLKDVEFNSKKTVSALEGMTGEDARIWLEHGGQNPFDLEKAKTYKEWQNVLERDENGVPAYRRMSVEELADDALKKGYRWYNMDERSAYMKQIQDLDIPLAKGEVVKKEMDSPAGIVTQAVAPSATEAAVAQALGSSDGDDQEIWNALGIDALANTAMAATPSAALLKGKPIVNGLINGVGQGLLEAGRNVASDINQGKKVDFEKAAKSGGVSSGLGMTVPGFVGFASATTGTIPGMRNFARGMSQSTKAADPIVMERSSINKALKDAENVKANKGKILLNPKNEQMVSNAERGEELRSVLGGGDDNSVLGSYDQAVAGEGVLNPSLTIDATKAERETYDKAKTLLPAAVQAVQDQGTTAALGKKIGSDLLELGGRVEPIVQGNPFKQEVRSYDTKNYKNSDWYKKLTPMQKKAVDEAFSAKQKTED